MAKFTYRNPQGMYTTAFGLIMNDETYNDLSAAHRKCIDDIRGVSMASQIGEYWMDSKAARSLLSLSMQACDRPHYESL